MLTWEAHAGAVTRLRSVSAWSTGMSAYVPPARVTSGPTAGYEEHRLPPITRQYVQRYLDAQPKGEPKRVQDI